MVKQKALPSVLYIVIIVAALAGTYAYKIRWHGLFACTSEGYRYDRYLGYCDADAYGDYDHGAVWFGLEPDTQTYAAKADVLFLGNSRMQFAFSTIATDKWFAATDASHYLLGFSHNENVNFAEPLLAKLKPQAKVYVIGVDRFFGDRITGPASEILNDAQIERRYKEKRLWQQIHRKVCARAAWLCGNTFGYFRASKTGHWVVRGMGKNDTSPVSDGEPIEQELWSRNATLAQQFIDELPVDQNCVLLTLVPYPKARTAEAQALAAALGLDLIKPEVEGLRTYDGSHLDGDSAQRWSKAFFDLADVRIKQCLSYTSDQS